MDLSDSTNFVSDVRLVFYACFLMLNFRSSIPAFHRQILLQIYLLR